MNQAVLNTQSSSIGHYNGCDATSKRVKHITRSELFLGFMSYVVWCPFRSILACDVRLVYDAIKTLGIDGFIGAAAVVGYWAISMMCSGGFDTALMLAAYDIAFAFILVLLSQLQIYFVLHASLLAVVVFAWSSGMSICRSKICRIMIFGTIVIICWEPWRSLGGVNNEIQHPTRETSGDDLTNRPGASKEFVLTRDKCGSNHVAFEEQRALLQLVCEWHVDVKNCTVPWTESRKWGNAVERPPHLLPL